MSMTLDEMIAHEAGLADSAKRRGYEKTMERHNQIVKCLIELRERRKAPEIVRCGECVHSNKEYSGEMWCGICNGFGIDENSFCSFAERRTDGE